MEHTKKTGRVVFGVVRGADVERALKRGGRGGAGRNELEFVQAFAAKCQGVPLELAVEASQRVVSALARRLHSPKEDREALCLALSAILDSRRRLAEGSGEAALRRFAALLVREGEPFVHRLNEVDLLKGWDIGFWEGRLGARTLVLDE